MAAELALHYASGIAISACILSVDLRKVWNGASLVRWSELSLAEWLAGLIPCAEQSLGSGEPTGLYVGDFPAIAEPGEYAVLFYEGASPRPADEEIGTQGVDWTGSALGNGAVLAVAANLQEVGTKVDATSAQLATIAATVARLPEDPAAASGVPTPEAIREEIDAHSLLLATIEQHAQSALDVLGTPAGEDLAADLAAVAAKTGLIGTAGQLVARSNTPSVGVIDITRGDDCTVKADGRDDRIILVDALDAWPDLGGCTIALTARNRDSDAVEIQLSGAAIARENGHQRMAFTVTHGQTAAMRVATGRGHKYDVQITDSGGNVTTLHGVAFCVREDQTR